MIRGCRLNFDFTFIFKHDILAIIPLSYPILFRVDQGSSSSSSSRSICVRKFESSV
jgi:hypothetical protein